MSVLAFARFTKTINLHQVDKHISLLMQCSAQLLGKNGKLGFDDKG